MGCGPGRCEKGASQGEAFFMFASKKKILGRRKLSRLIQFFHTDNLVESLKKVVVD